MLIVHIASSRCSGQVFGMSSVVRDVCLSSPRFGAHSRLSMCSRILLVPSTSPLIHGEYVGTV